MAALSEARVALLSAHCGSLQNLSLFEMSDDHLSSVLRGSHDPVLNVGGAAGAAGASRPRRPHSSSSNGRGSFTERPRSSSVRSAHARQLSQQPPPPPRTKTKKSILKSHEETETQEELDAQLAQFEARLPFHAQPHRRQFPRPTRQVIKGLPQPRQRGHVHCTRHVHNRGAAVKHPLEIDCIQHHCQELQGMLPKSLESSTLATLDELINSL